MNTKEQIIEKLKIWFKKTNIISYDKDIDLQCWDKELKELRDGNTKEVYVVSFKTEDKIEYDENGEIISLFEGMYCFAYFDAETLELLYIHKKAGYIEVDGSY
jgi:serine protease inhibitor